jgi:hypothetical protein
MLLMLWPTGGKGTDQARASPPHRMQLLLQAVRADSIRLLERVQTSASTRWCDGKASHGILPLRTKPPSATQASRWYQVGIPTARRLGVAHPEGLAALAVFSK